MTTYKARARTERMWCECNEQMLRTDRTDTGEWRYRCPKCGRRKESPIQYPRTVYDVDLESAVRGPVEPL